MEQIIGQECEFYQEGHCDAYSNFDTYPHCIDYPNCYYKQLQTLKTRRPKELDESLAPQVESNE